VQTLERRAAWRGWSGGRYDARNVDQNIETMQEVGILRNHRRKRALMSLVACSALLASAPIAGATGAIMRAATTPGVTDLFPPILSGTAAVGQALSCTRGLWNGGPAITYEYRWLRDGSAIAGATGDTYTVRLADRGHGLRCEVTATDSGGQASAESNALIVPAASPAPSAAQAIAISPRTLVVVAGVARVRVSCATVPCSGVIELTEPIEGKHRKGSGATPRTETETLVLARGSFALATAHDATFPIRVSRAARTRLARAPHRGLPVVLVASVAGQTVREPARLREARARR
jgi:hypothetical protein